MFSASIWLSVICVGLLVGIVFGLRLYFSDKYQTKIAKDKITKYFDFLFERGFTIEKVEYSPNPNGAWLAVLKSDQCKIRVIQDRGDIYCEVAPAWASDKKFEDLAPMIARIEKADKNKYYPQTRRNIDIQLEYYAKLIDTHLSQIVILLDSYPKLLYKTIE